MTPASRHQATKEANGSQPEDHIGRSAIALLTLLVPCFIGFVGIGVATRDPGPKTVTVGNGVSFTEPAGLQPVAAPSGQIASALGIEEAVVYAPVARESEGATIVGTSEGQGPLLLTGEAVSNLRNPDRPQIEHLGQSLIAVRVSGLLGAAGTDGSGAKADASYVIVYSVPLIPLAGQGTTTTVNVVCVLGSGPHATPTREACERLSTTLQVQSDLGHPFELTRLRRYYARLASILRRYRDEIVNLRTELQRVRHASGQAYFAALLAKLCSATAGQIAALIPGDPIALPALRTLRLELERSAAAYSSLASAAADGSRRAYNEARDRLSSDDTATQKAVQATWAS